MDLDFPKHFSGQVMWYYVTMRPCFITFSCASIYTLNQGFLVLSHATMVVPPSLLNLCCGLVCMMLDSGPFGVSVYGHLGKQLKHPVPANMQYSQPASIECTGFLRTDKLLLTAILLIVISFHISLLPCSQFAVYTAFTGPVNPDRGQ